MTNKYAEFFKILKYNLIFLRIENDSIVFKIDFECKEKQYTSGMHFSGGGDTLAEELKKVIPIFKMCQEKGIKYHLSEPMVAYPFVLSDKGDCTLKIYLTNN